jgi:eukaryotic-like serine/threonine-protein kinase
MVGRVLGNCQIDGRVGEGGFAVVYKGRDVRLNRSVAIKVLKDKHVQGNTVWGQLLYEARIASTLNHPNICTLYDIGEEQDINYVVFEFVEGKTLRAILKSGPLPIHTVFEYGIQIAEANAYIHTAGLLHQDLKSSNIMVTPEGRIKLVDFGLATHLNEECAKHRDPSHSYAEETVWPTGTLPYMAPELLRGETATKQSGVWSLGVVLFEMLTGHLPFAGRSPFELGMDIMIGKAKAVPMDVPAGMRAIVQRCLSREKEYRYYSAVEVLDHLRSEFIAYKVRSTLANRPSLQNQGYMAGWWRAVLIWILMVFGN